MASKAALRRLTKEAQLMESDPPPFVFARPREDNILEWHYILRGPPDTPYAGGEYHGQLLFPPEFPFKPPGIKMSTPSGRFKPDTKICTSMSDYHPHTWQPGWNTSTILIGLLSFMCSDEMTTGSVTASTADRRALASRSHDFNLTNKRFVQLFPEYSGPVCRDLPNMGETKAASEKQAESTGAGVEEGKTATPKGLTRRSFHANETTGDAATGDRGQGGPLPRQPPPPAPRRDLFGVRSSMLVLALLVYLFLSRALSSGSSSSGAAAAAAA